MFASDSASVASDPAPARVLSVPEDPRTRDPLVLAIGHTPLWSLARLVGGYGGVFELYAKAEYLNPTGSVKDRAAWGMVREGLRTGGLGKGRSLIDASSGNTAVSYATLGARLGFPVELVLPRTVTEDRVALIRSLGATIVFTDPLEGTDGAQREARRRAEADPARYYFPDQYNNPANPEAHFRTTGPEIWDGTRGRITHFVAGVGTGGTISGTARYLRSRDGRVRIVGVEPAGPVHGLEGLKHLPTALRPSTYDGRLVDETIRVETEDALRACARLAREEGIVAGVSSGAAVAASLEVGRRNPGAVVVTVLPDRGHAPAGGEGR